MKSNALADMIATQLDAEGSTLIAVAVGNGMGTVLYDNKHGERICHLFDETGRYHGVYSGSGDNPEAKFEDRARAYVHQNRVMV